jgi:hypothetical protein
LIQELRLDGWEYVPTQTNGAPHFIHPHYGKVAIASTPADWEDECNYTRQRIRKAMRRRAEVPAPTEKRNSLDLEFSEIEILEKQLAQLQTDGLRFLADLKSQITPFYAQMADVRRSMVALLGNALCDARWKRRQVEDLKTICILIADTTLQRLQVNLDSEFSFLPVIRKELSQIPDESDEEDEDPFAHFDADAWERWFEEQESNTTYIPESRPKEKPKPPKKSEPSVDVQTMGRKLYLGLAKELHPDKTAIEEERVHRTHLMKQLNAAYSKGDLKTLLSILHLHGSTESRSSIDASTQAALLAALEEQKLRLRAQIQQAIAELPEIDGDWRAILASEKQREFFLRRERRAAESEVMRLRDILKEMETNQGLARILREITLEDWNNVF